MEDGRSWRIKCLSKLDIILFYSFLSKFYMYASFHPFGQTDK